jgi:hypothetical protein
MQAITIQCNRIEIDPLLQPRVDGIDLDHVHALEAVVAACPPLKVVRQGDGYLLVDGFHRFAAAQNLGLAEIDVEVLDTPADGDLHSLAFALNAAHGRPLTLSDRRAYAARLLHAHPDWSDREIGRRAGLVQPTVAKVRQELERENEIQPVTSRTGRDGRIYPSNPRQSSPDAERPTLLDAIVRIFTPAERTAQRTLTRYLQRIADALEQQDQLNAFETIDSAAEACRVVLGDAGAKELAGRLGWSSRNIVQIAEALGDVETQP